MNDSDVSPLRKQFLGISDAPHGPVIPFIMGGTMNLNPPLRPCLHEKCPECHGSGRKKTGQTCLHMISCGCQKCKTYGL